MVCRVSIFI